MKLQDKKQVNNDMQSQRRSQMEEGVRLAKHIDVLRETLASLEAQHANFIQSSQQRYKEMVGPLETQVSDLKSQITRLEERRAILMKPLDEEWDKVNEVKAQQEQNALSLTDREAKIKEEEERQFQDNRGLDRRKLIVADTELQAENTRKEAGEKMERANALLSNAEERNRVSIDECARREETLSKKEDENNRWATALGKRESALDVREKDLNDRERAINDKFALFERTINRVKK